MTHLDHLEIVDTSELLKSNKKFYKFTNELELHHWLKYQDGEIIDPLPFNPSGKCSKGGMYFFEQSQLLKYDDYVINPRWIREVVLLPESKVYKELNKYKTDRFVMKERKRFNGDLSGYITNSMCIEEVKDWGLSLKNVPQSLITQKMCWDALKQNVMVFKFIPLSLLNEKMCFDAIEGYAHNVEYIPLFLLNEEMSIEAVKINGMLLKVIPNLLKTEEMCLIAIRQNKRAIRYIPSKLWNVEMYKIGYS